MKQQHPSETQKLKIQKSRIEETKMMDGILIKYIQNSIPYIKHNLENRKEGEKRVSNTISQRTTMPLSSDVGYWSVSMLNDLRSELIK